MVLLLGLDLKTIINFKSGFENPTFIALACVNRPGRTNIPGLNIVKLQNLTH
jgi:hypothetical protein